MKPRPRTASFYSLNAGGVREAHERSTSLWGKWAVQSKVQSILMECWGVAVDMRVRLRLP